ncbi:MAG: winged helix-turn-helix domain-containing protein [Planctomycetaceae bacterium]|nr:winged helix-turn-helix domain-containing protein [Planctomycetaceae bacterium]
MSETSIDTIAEIGSAAGKIWAFLNENGACSLSRLIKETDVSRDLVLQGIGWLAREDKLVFNKVGRGRTIALKQQEN